MSTEIATIEPGGYLALNHDLEEVTAFIDDNLQGQDIGEFDLQRLTVPSGKAQKYRWEVPTLGGDTENVDEVTGIIIFQKQTRSWWPAKPEETTGNIPPSCSSPDGRVGFGKQWATKDDPDPDGDPTQVACASCPHSQFGSDGGRGQACKQQAQLFLLREVGFLPIVVSIPPTSLKPLKQYMLALANSGIHYSQVVTGLGLEKKANAGGTDFALVTPRLAGRLDPGDAARAKAYGTALRETLTQVATAVAGGDGNPPAGTPPTAAATPAGDDEPAADFQPATA